MKNIDVLLICLRTGHNETKRFFQLGPAYLVSALRQIEIEPDLLCLDVFGYDNQYVESYIKRKRYDLIGFGFLFDNIREAINTVKMIRTTGPNSKILIGGPGPSCCPDFMLRKTKADILAIGESEITIQHLVKALSNSKSLESVPGLYISEGGVIKKTGPAEIHENLSECPLPAWDKFPMKYYLKTARVPATEKDNYMCMITSRGCKHNCNFCYHTNKFRLRPVENVVHEIKLLKELYKVNFIQFYDDLFMSDKERTLSLCQAFIKEKLNIKYRILGRVDVVDKEQILALKESGCSAIGYGIESGDQGILDFMHKKVTTEQILHAVSITKQAGICVTTPVMFGQPGENRETLASTKKLLLEIMDPHERDRSIRPLTLYPGTTIFRWAMRNGYIRDEEDFFEKYKHAGTLSVNFTELNDNDFLEELSKANREVKDTFSKRYGSV